MTATIGWGVATLDAISQQFALEREGANLLLSAAIVSTGWIMLSARTRPLAAAYDLGYETGHRDAMLAGNRSNVIQFSGRRSALLARGEQIRLDCDA